jgi:hypothetical protein
MLFEPIVFHKVSLALLDTRIALTLYTALPLIFIPAALERYELPGLHESGQMPTTLGAPHGSLKCS